MDSYATANDLTFVNTWFVSCIYQMGCIKKLFRYSSSVRSPQSLRNVHTGRYAMRFAAGLHIMPSRGCGDAGEAH